MMNDLYQPGENCLNFTNEAMVKHLIRPLGERGDMDIYLASREPDEENLPIDTKNPITWISFDGERGNFAVSFYGHQVSIFTSDETWAAVKRKWTFNEEFMFIDDKVKEVISSSDTYHNVVYEGTLRDKTHEEILGIILEFILLLNGAQHIKIEEKVVSQEGIHYPKCDYTVHVINETKGTERIQMENILFVFNEKE